MLRDGVYLKILLLVFFFGFAPAAYSEGKKTLYFDLVDRKNKEDEIMGGLESGLYCLGDINNIYSESSIMEDSNLRVAVFRNFDDVVDYLLDHGADPNLKLKNNCSALGVAISNANDEIVKKLLQANADTKLPMCWPEGSKRLIRMDNAIVQYELKDETRMDFMRAHAASGGDLSQRLLSFSIFNNKPDIARLYVELMPNFRSERLLSMAKSRSKTIYSILKESWSRND